MTRKHLGRAATVAIAVGVTIASPTSIAVAAPAATHSVSAQTLEVCGYLNDGAGAGSANSLTPGTTPYAGEAFTQQNDSVAWRMCLNGSGSFMLYPASASGMCEADNNGVAKLRDCNPGHTDQLWYETSASGGFHLKNANGGYLCADDGVGSLDIVVPLSNCSSYHDTWEWR